MPVSSSLSLKPLTPQPENMSQNTSPTPKPGDADFLGIDWGTTHRRGYRFAGPEASVQVRADADGALACKGRFAAALVALEQQLDCAPSRVVMAGMVGSALGWETVPYVDASVRLQSLPQHLHRLADSSPGHTLQVVPGYCVRDAHGRPDVMRGEETQLLGAVMAGHANGWFVLPGTHSKWVFLEEGYIRQLRTYMTGEIFDLLRKQGTIASAIGGAAIDTAARSNWDAQAFADGVAAAAQGALAHLLFGVRARVVCGDLAPASATAYLSGLLIGHELHDVVGNGAGVDRFCIIGSPALATLYTDAAQSHGLACEALDAEQLFIAAMQHFRLETYP